MRKEEAKSDAGLWINHNYLYLFAGQVISLLGSGVTTVALAIFASAAHVYCRWFGLSDPGWIYLSARKESARTHFA